MDDFIISPIGNPPVLVTVLHVATHRWCRITHSSREKNWLIYVIVPVPAGWRPTPIYTNLMNAFGRVRMAADPPTVFIRLHHATTLEAAEAWARVELAGLDLDVLARAEIERLWKEYSPDS